jgi:hypothetical protein
MSVEVQLASLGERMMRMETLQAASETQTKMYRVEVKDEIKQLNTKIDSIDDSLKNISSQFQGGKKVVRSLWWLGGVLIAGGAFISGKAHSIASFFSSVR